jgi:cell division protein FtsQ
VFALKGDRHSYPAESGAAHGERDAHGVLPRPLRRAVRLAVSLSDGRITFPAYTGLLSMALFFGATGLYGMTLGGHTRDVAQATTSAVGFSINNIKVSGNVQTSEIDILQQLGLDGSSSVISLDAADARRKLIDLPWVQDAQVRKIYPDTVAIQLSERTAFGIWQHGDELSLIEKDGKVIAPLRDNKFTNLPLFVGEDAETEAAAFAEQLANWPAIQARVKAYICVGGRRWDLRLDNGVVIRLPEENIARAMHVLSTMEDEHQLLERDIVTVDLRLADRTSIQLTEAASARRAKAVADRAKELKKQERAI